MHIALLSFGFKYGFAEADYVLDLRFLPNPYWDEKLRPFPGTDARVASYVLDHADTTEFLAFVQALLIFVCTACAKTGRKELRIALGCTGGRHRSVAISEHLATWLGQKGYEVTCQHRDMLRDTNEQPPISLKPCQSAVHPILEAPMKELLKNIMYAGLGAAFLTKEKFEELQEELTEKGKMSQEEGKQFVDELRLKSERAREQLDLWVSSRVEERVRQLNLATRDEIADLQRKIDELHALLNRDSSGPSGQ
ncbi:MAG: hypothetical protein HQQ73_05760 [Desulfobulbaceae bacterium]|nr:hypothetical protein [Desulfobulbaceae bacterium]